MPNSQRLLLLPIVALIAPFLIWPIEQVFPYPYLVEELLKGLFVWQILSVSSKRVGIKLVVLVATLFALSETVFYLINIIQTANFQILFTRLVLTTSLHNLTSLVIFFFAWKKSWLIFVGLIIAIVIHYFFNIWASGA